MRRFAILSSIVAILAVVPFGKTQTPQLSVGGPTIPTDVDMNPELLQLVTADQWDRGNDLFAKGLPESRVIGKFGFQGQVAENPFFMQFS
jgi:hypothetical protein